ncbi:cation transporter [Xylanimonas oleitrophica]|uniref:Cation transporter n=1 Tax=Xylanimonas oleitrophica TaxID=2607479 RepID=A0A2W5WUQ0_9MICO|nr:cation diffusion facilitator family transporter [Xylanimonas oleitrophica]PZR55007.1 cation transporter [Xylanimonas oleitrophica]
MGAGHAHGPAVSSGRRHLRPLVIAFSLTATFMVVEFVVGFWTGSLALISDAAHMGTDVIGLGMAMAAILVASRSTDPQRTYGLYRLEVLAALANGVLLFGVAGWVLVEAVRRFSEPPEVPGLPLLVTAVLGLVVNVISFRLLAAGAKESLNVRGAHLEVLGDLLGSVGVVVAAVVLWTTGWSYVDPLVGVAIGLFILPRTWRLSRQALRILLEVAPPEVEIAQVRDALLAVPGVAAVHDLHVWTITSGMDSASAHVVVEAGADRDTVLTGVHAVLRERFEVTHATIQCEAERFGDEEAHHA